MNHRFLIFGLCLVLLVASIVFPCGTVYAGQLPGKHNPPRYYSISAPENLTAAAVTSTQITLTWEDKADNEVRYKVERRTGRGSYFELTLLGKNATTYTDSGLIPGTTYYYRVQVIRNPWDTAYSNEASAETPLPPLAGPEPVYPGNSFLVGTLTPRFQWSQSENARTYTIQVASDAGFSDVILERPDIEVPFYELPPGLVNWQRSYHWRIRSLNMDGTSSDWSASLSFTVLPDFLSVTPHCNCH